MTKRNILIFVILKDAVLNYDCLYQSQKRAEIAAFGGERLAV